MTEWLERIAPNRDLPFLDHGYFRVHLGRAAGRAIRFASRHSRWLSEFFEAAGYPDDSSS